MSEKIIKAVEEYFEFFNSQDAQGIAQLYADNAKVTDPVGTPTKVGKFTPGTHIPILKYNGIPNNVRFAFLGAWNFKDEIFKKEKAFIKRGGKFISHVPYPRIL